MEASTHPDRTIIISALAFGAMGGLFLGSYLWRSGANEHKLSQHLGTLSRIMEEIEAFDLEETDLLKERVEQLIKTIKASYGES